MSETIVFGGSNSQLLAKKVAELLNFKLGLTLNKRFPDGELYLKVEENVKDRKCIVIQSTSYPQDKNLLELYNILDTLKDMGAKKITTVVPYFGYGRQDKSFTPGESVTSKTIARHLSLNSDEFISINLHEEAILDYFNIPGKNLDACPLIGKYIKNYRLTKPLVLGPDKSALPMTKEVSEAIKADFDYLEKTRLGPGDVEIKPKSLDVNGKDVVLLDDMIDSGGSMIEAIKILKKDGVKNLLVGTVHPVLTGNALTKIFHAGATDVIATDTICSEVSRISVAGLISDTFKNSI